MKAMIFAAGLGTRLRPLTDSMPKALVPVGGRPLLEILIKKMIRQGFDEIIINVHHFAEQIIEFLDKRERFGIEIAISDERDMLLDTGGGLKKAGWFFDDNRPFLAHNADILSGVDLGTLYQSHLQGKERLATLLVRHREGNRFLLFDPGLRLCGWENIQTGEKIIGRETDRQLQRLAFSGIQIIDPRIFRYLDQTGPFSIIKTYLELAGKEWIAGQVDDQNAWIDVGTPEKLQQAAQYLDQVG